MTAGRIAAAMVVAIAWGGSVLVRAVVPAPEIVSEVRIRGNYRTPDEDVLRLAGVAIGQPLGTGGTEAVAERLRKTGRFDAVEVRKRYRSLTEDGPVALVIFVQERPGVDPLGRMPGPMRRLGAHLMVLPVFDYTDGFGATYGGRISFVDLLGKEGRVSVPLTWGGWKRAALEIDRTWAAGPVSRVQVAVSASSRENPYFRIDDRRNEVQVAADRVVRRRLSLGARVGWTDVTFADRLDRFTTYGLRLVADSRTNPAFPRNAVYARVSWDAFDPRAGRTINRYGAELDGYLGLGKPVLAVRSRVETADGFLPPYEKPLLGGAGSLRGFRAGSFVGDNLVAASIELRLPVTSPMHVGQSGIAIFADAGSVTDHGTRLRDARFERGFGAGWYLSAPMIRLGVDVAHGVGAGTRVHVTAGLKF